MNTDSPPHAQEEISDSRAVAIGRRVTWAGFWVNALLGVLKVIAGILGRSGAMVADGIHSFSDFITDVIVIVMLGLSRRGVNSKYQYGHGKYETMAVMLISLALAAVALGIFYEGIVKILDTLRGATLPRPGMIALIMAVASIIAKECLFHYTRYWGERIRSAAVVANAWHHRSDSLSSLATLFGITGAMFLGEQWRILDPLAAIIVGVFIFIVAIKTGMPAVRELLDVSLPPDITTQFYKTIASTPGIITFHRFRSRKNGANIIVDMHIKVSPDITVVTGHDIASNLEKRLRDQFGKAMLVNIHVEPYKGETILPDGSCAD